MKKPSHAFLSVQPVGYRKPAGADPFTYQDKRPLRWRASWWTRGTTTEMYRGKIVATKEEAVRLALKWLDKHNKQYADRPEYMHVDTTDYPERYGYAHEPEAHATKKSAKLLDDDWAHHVAPKKTAAQLDADIAEVIGKETL